MSAAVPSREGNPLGELTVLRERVAHLESENLSLVHRLRDVDLVFYDITNNTHSVISVVDAALQKQIYVSPGYEALWERPCATLYSAPNSWLEGVWPDDLPRVRAALQKPEKFDERYRISGRGGDFKWVRTRFTPVRDQLDKIVRYIAFTEDITDWKRLEAQLLQSQKMDAIGRLAGGVAHDFNNLLTVINGYSAMLMDRLDLAEDVCEDLASIRRAGNRAAALTAQLLAFSRKAITSPTVLVLHDAIAKIEPMLRRLIPENVDLLTTAIDHEASIKMDPTQFEQVIMNLTINSRDAIDATGLIAIETGKKHLDAEASRLHGNRGPGDYAFITVNDNGKGMSPATQERIFEPFFTTKESGRGTGLGLATVYGIITQSGGTISVESQEGVGTTFKIYLPLFKHPGRSEVLPSSERAASGSGNILLVEDDEQVRLIASEVLRKRGYTVTQASNGEEAARIAASLPTIDLLVTDVVMPKMGGRELAESLAASNPAMKVLFMSGYTENAAIPSGQTTAPKQNLLAKPFSPDALARKVGEVLATKHKKPRTASSQIAKP